MAMAKHHMHLLDAHLRVKGRGAGLTLICMASRETHDRPSQVVVRCVDLRQMSDSPHPGADSVVSAVAGSANIVHVVHDVCSKARSVGLSVTISSGGSILQAHTALTVHTIHIGLCLKQAACLPHNDGEPVAVVLKAIPNCVEIAERPASKAGSRIQDAGLGPAHCPGLGLAACLALAAGPATQHAGCRVQALVARLWSTPAALTEQLQCSSLQRPWNLTSGSKAILGCCLWVAGPALCVAASSTTWVPCTG